MQLKDHKGTVRGLKIIHPDTGKQIELVSSYLVGDDGVGFWYKVDSMENAVSVIIFDNKDDALNLEIFL